MTARDIVKAIMEKEQVRPARMAAALQVSPQVINSRLNSPKSNNLTAQKLNEMLRYLGYDLVILPRGKVNRIDGAYLVEDEKK